MPFVYIVSVPGTAKLAHLVPNTVDCRPPMWIIFFDSTSHRQCNEFSKVFQGFHVLWSCVRIFVLISGIVSPSFRCYENELKRSLSMAEVGFYTKLYSLEQDCDKPSVV